MAGSDKNNVFRYKELYEKYGELPELGDIKLGGTDEIITVKLCVPEKGVEVEKSFSIYDTVSGASDSGGGGGNNTSPTFCRVFIRYLLNMPSVARAGFCLLFLSFLNNEIVFVR